MIKTKKISVSNSQVESILKYKNKSSYYNIFDTKNDFKIGKLKILNHSFLNSSNKKKFQELYLGNLRWMDGEDNIYKVDFNLQAVFDLDESYKLDTYNISIDTYCMSTLLSSTSSSINRNNNDCYDMVTYSEGSKTQRKYHGQSYKLNDHFADEAIIMDPHKNVGEIFEYNALDGDENLIEIGIFKYVNNFYEKNKEFHIYQMDLSFTDLEESLKVTIDNTFSVKEFECGQFIAKLNRKIDYKESMN